jgi:HTH-type transcriptional regulator/antitoxin HigA
MTAVLESPEGVRDALENLHKLMEQLRGQYVHGINGADDYARATVLLDELTDGHDLTRYEEQILIELEEAIHTYEHKGEQLKAFNAAVKASTSPVQLLKDLMETLQLTGSDLPEIGDKTTVSKVLNGDRPISHKMAFALAERFNMHPSAFMSKSEISSGRPGLKVHVSLSHKGGRKSTTSSRILKTSDSEVPVIETTLRPMPSENRLVAKSSAGRPRAKR